MGITKIEWTATVHADGTVSPGYSFNPWVGCTKVSDGCKFCYAETLMDHRYGKVKWGPQGTRQRTSAAYWRQPLQWNNKAQADGKRYRVFCASLADVFEDRPELAEWRAGLLHMIQQTPHLDWLLLTKRPENINRMIEQATGFSDSAMWFHSAPHVWIGTSVENQAAADERIPHLLNVPTAVRFLSCEPLLGPVDLRKCYEKEVVQFNGGINWVIAGGESGQNARPMHPAWARALRDQCKADGVPFLFKQWGEWGPGNASDETFAKVANGKCGMKILDDLTVVYDVGKKAAGRLLDGVEYSQFPQ